MSAALKALACTVLALLLVAEPARADEALWTALADGGHVALMRHALAPGTGDPEHFRLDECSTQRNLDQTGREQARRTGQAFRERGVEIGQVLSSQWCRCLETAELLALGEIEPFPPLNSFFGAPERGADQTEAVRAFLANAAEPRDGHPSGQHHGADRDSSRLGRDRGAAPGWTRHLRDDRRPCGVMIGKFRNAGEP